MESLGPWPCLLGIKMRKAHDAAWQALLMAVELADLDFCADCRMSDINASERDVFLEERRADATRHHADLGAPDMHTVAVADSVISVNVEADELVARMLLALDERCLADEVVVFGLERHGEADTGLEWIGLICEFIMEEDEARFDAHHVERLEAERRNAVLLTRLPNRVEEG